MRLAFTTHRSAAAVNLNNCPLSRQGFLPIQATIFAKVTTKPICYTEPPSARDLLGHLVTQLTRRYHSNESEEELETAVGAIEYFRDVQDGDLYLHFVP